MHAVPDGVDRVSPGLVATCDVVDKDWGGWRGLFISFLEPQFLISSKTENTWSAYSVPEFDSWVSFSVHSPRVWLHETINRQQTQRGPGKLQPEGPKVSVHDLESLLCAGLSNQSSEIMSLTAPRSAQGKEHSTLAEAGVESDSKTLGNYLLARGKEISNGSGSFLGIQKSTSSCQ